MDNNNYCCVPKCNSLGSHVPRTSFHRFPSDKSEISKRRRDEWIRLLKIGKKVTNRMVVCGKHFMPSDFFPKKNGPLHRTNLRKNAIPSQNLPLASCEDKEKLDHKKKESLIRLERRERCRDEHLSDNYQLTDMLNCAEPSHINMDNVTLHNDAIPGLFDDVPAGEEDCDRILAAEALVSLFQSTKVDKEIQVTSGDLVLCRSFIKNMSESGLKTMTGPHSFNLLDTLIDLLKESYGISLKCHQMPLKDQIILTFMRLKVDLSFAALSVLFECSQVTCKSIFKDLIENLAVHLKSAIYWPSKENILDNMSLCFKNYRKTRVTLDCTEVKVSKPACAKCRIMSYSQYKGCHTIKIMIGISPAGIITFLSSVYPGRASDKIIFEQSGLIEFLQPHEDAVMVDKGFHVEDICSKAFVDLIRPPYLRQKSQFSAKEAEVNIGIARARVHVERVIQRIKIFEIFQSSLPWGMLPHIQNIFTVCAAITNLGKPIISEEKF